MLENLDQGLKATNSIVSLIEKIASHIVNIKSNREKKVELNRLIELLNETRISRTLNAGLLWYLRQSIEDYKNGSNKHELEVAVAQIEKSISSMFEIIDTMSEKNDKIVLYENGSWNNLHSVVNGRKRLIDELKGLEINKRNLNKLESIANRYEALTSKLNDIAFDLSKHGREINEKLHQ